MRILLQAFACVLADVALIAAAPIAFFTWLHPVHPAEWVAVVTVSCTNAWIVARGGCFRAWWNWQMKLPPERVRNPRSK